MKKIILLTGVFIVAICLVLWASSWTSDVVVALETQNNMTNTGSDSGLTFTYGGTAPYSNTVYYMGSYSAGQITADTQAILADQAMTHTICTIQLAVRVEATGLPAVAILAWHTNSTMILYQYGSHAVYLHNGGAQIGPYSYGTYGAFHLFTINYDGTHMDLWIDGVHQGQISATQYTTQVLKLGGRNAGEFCNCYIGEAVLSTANSVGTEIVPVVSTPTFTVTPIPPTSTFTITPTFTITRTFTVTPTSTFDTPTPENTVSLCGVPFPRVFTPNPTPVFVALAGGYEQGYVGEPNVMDYGSLRGMNAVDRFQMFYSAGAFDFGGVWENLCIATAPKPWGPWTRYGTTPIFGDGFGGVNTKASMPFQTKVGAEYRVYFKRAGEYDYEHFVLLGPFDIVYATSADGYNYTLVGTALPMSLFSSPCPGVLGMDGMGIVNDGTDYWAIAEVAMSGTCSSPVYPGYTLWLGKGVSHGADSFQLASYEPLSDLGSFPSGKLYANGRGTVKTGSNYHTWTHNDYPTKIYHGKSNDLYNWRVDGVAVAEYTSTMWGLTDVDQLENPCMVEYDGNLYMFCDATSNSYRTGAIGIYHYVGTLAQYDACELPSPTFTQTPTFTVTPTVTPTFTVTPTYTYTITPTWTFTATPTVTPTNTPWPDYILNLPVKKDPWYKGPWFPWLDKNPRTPRNRK
jgi:hypothetical protein